ncbi:hypothetical protein [Paenibacillus sp. FSL R5-0486]|uniref:hypothetical protein n=1 Tax=Paenibacillus sp. FSL R5-0486 TaxID=2921645 RepID=UPI0030DA5739
MRRLPLFIVTGASGTGKTTISSLVRKQLPEFDVFDMDIIFMWNDGPGKYCMV